VSGSWGGNTGLYESEQAEEKSMPGKKGFGSLDPEKHKAIASKGGKKAHEKGTAHKWDKAEAAAAGKKGGTARKNKEPL
jgi:uncharacterized protein